MYEKRHVQFFIDQKARSRYLRILQWAIIVAIFVFLGVMVWGNWNQVKDASFTFEVFPLLLSILIFAISYLIQVWAWYLITLKLKIAISLFETLKTWFYSQLGKYLPGKIWLLLGRIYCYESRGQSKKSISVALYFEMVTALMAGGFVFLASLIFFGEIWPFYSLRQPGWFILLFVLGLVSLHPGVLRRIFNWGLVRLNRERIYLPISYLDVLWILFICIVAWLVGGIGFYIFVASVYPVAPQYILFLTGALAISSILGLIAIFAPSGLGVREGALVYLLSFMMATPVAVIISILTRIWMTLIEIGLIGVIYLFDKFRNRETRKGRGTT